MTTKKQTTTTTSSTTSHRSSVSMSWFMNILAFAAVCIGGIALFLAMILNNLFGLTASWISSMQSVANAIGWLALCLLSMRYISRRRKLSIWIIWGVAVFMIVSGTIIPLFK